jgi:hypothetical protein
VKRSKYRSKRPKFYCKIHRANTTHASINCRVLQSEGPKKKDYDNRSKYIKDSKYKKKYKEFHLMQDTKEGELRKYKRRLAVWSKSNSSSSTSSEDERPKRDNKKRQYRPVLSNTSQSGSSQHNHQCYSTARDMVSVGTVSSNDSKSE